MTKLTESEVVKLMHLVDVAIGLDYVINSHMEYSQSLAELEDLKIKLDDLETEDEFDTDVAIEKAIAYSHSVE